METWIDWAVKLPAIPDPAYPVKWGYPGVPTRPLTVVQYVVNHSAEGGIAYLKQGNRPGEQASWTFSNALDGTLYQHYPLEYPTWTSGNPAANIAGVGVEHEGHHLYQPQFTDAQADTDVRLFRSLQTLCPNLLPPVHGQGVRIHREVAPGTTSCPDGRERWDKYEQLAQGGDDMTPEEVYAQAKQAVIDVLRSAPEFAVPTRLQVLSDKVDALSAKIDALPAAQGGTRKGTWEETT